MSGGNMDDKEFYYINAIPGVGAQGMEVIGMSVASTSGFWFEVDKDQPDWVGVDVRPVYTIYNNK
jgi:hypothetical protein